MGGARFVAELLHQAFLVAADSPEALRRVVGAAIDLLVWIPKREGDDSVAAQRPLQLPSCLRRLFGAALAEAAGPVLERGLSRHQVAKRGGSCGPNIRALFRHLSQPGGLPGLLTRGVQGPRLRVPREDLWAAFLGRAA